MDALLARMKPHVARCSSLVTQDSSSREGVSPSIPFMIPTSRGHTTPSFAAQSVRAVSRVDSFGESAPSSSGDSTPQTPELRGESNQVQQTPGLRGELNHVYETLELMSARRNFSREVQTHGRFEKFTGFQCAVTQHRSFFGVPMAQLNFFGVFRDVLN